MLQRIQTQRGGPRIEDHLDIDERLRFLPVAE